MRGVSTAEVELAEMNAFEVYVNGAKVCTAGFPDGVLLVTARAGSGYGVMIDGLDAAAWEHVRWLSPHIAAGDEIRIVTVEADAVDAPAEREPADPPKRPARRDHVSEP